MLVFAHRGYHADVPQNTMESFRRAVALGADGIETDIRLSADGTPVLHHDRCVPNGMEISNFTYAELQKVVRYPVPTLESALAECGSVVWDLEIKTPSAVGVIVDVINRYKSTRRLLISSFLQPVVSEIVRRVDVEGGLIFAHLPQDSTTLCGPGKFHSNITTLIWDYEACTEKLIADSTRHGYKNFVYGTITPSDHQNVTDWAVDGVITDYPELGRR
jgi:glycerophosphoryl diester phosphodiesterase